MKRQADAATAGIAEELQKAAEEAEKQAAEAAKQAEADQKKAEEEAAKALAAATGPTAPADATRRCRHGPRPAPMSCWAGTSTCPMWPN